MEQNNFKKLKDLIKSEKQTFDVGNAARNLSLTTTVYHNAMKKNSFEELTESELLYIEEIVRILDERKERVQKLVASIAFN